MWQNSMTARSRNSHTLIDNPRPLDSPFHFHPILLAALPPCMLASFSSTADGVLKAGNIAADSFTFIF